MLILVQINAWAQSSGAITNGFNTESFPQISFIYHDYNPDILKKSDFRDLKENGILREFNSFEVLPANNLQEPQTILILWEDMAEHGVGQFEFTKKVLTEFFNEANLVAGERFFISAFNRRKNTSSALVNLTNGFISDKSQIINQIQSYKRSAEHYPEFPNRSDMYSAIREGLDLLQPIEGVKAIIIFTAGYSMKNSGSDSESQVLLKAQRLHIPVYVIEYYYKSGVAAEPENFAKSTNGLFFYYKDVSEAKKGLIDLYPKISERYYGHNYKIAFTTDAKRGDEARTISFKVNGMDFREQFFPPPFSLSIWAKENLGLAIGLIVAFTSLIVLIIILLIRNRRKKEAAIQANLENVRQEADDKTNAAKQEAERVRQEQIAYQQKQEREKLTAKVQAEQEHLAGLMQTKNLFPRLQCRVGNNNFTYNISKPYTTLGRKGYGNDIELDNEKVSRHHAEIIFTGGAFEIIDKKSTNKVIVNGQFFERATLKSGDIIGLGEAVITFYV